MIDRELLIMLNMIPTIGPKRIKNITRKIKTLSEFMNANFKQFSQIPGMSKKLWNRISYYRQKVDYKTEIQKAHKICAKIITIIDDEYPNMLKQIYDPPPVLYAMGDVSALKHKSLAIVGTRKATLYGKNIAKMFGEKLANLNFNVVSGMARGIDSCAHSGAIKAGGLTTAVLGSGINVIYPPENVNLMKNIIKNGCVISSFPIGTKPLAKNFPARNRIISGLSHGTIVIEAAQRSGSLITADFSLEQGREVFAVPGNINNPYSRGTHKLIKQGAKLVENIEDILEELSFEDLKQGILVKNEHDKPEVQLSEDEKDVYKIISYDPIHFEQIIQKTNLHTKHLNSIITRLELKGVITTLPGNYIVRI